MDSIDPSGLTSVFLDPVDSQKSEFVPCVSTASQAWNIGLTEKPPAGMTGWVVQKLCIKCGISDCPCNSNGTDWRLYDKHNDDKSVCFLEAWFVDGKGNLPITNDTFWKSAEPNKCGSFQLSGTMLFVERNVVNKVLKDAKHKPPMFVQGDRELPTGCGGTVKMGPYTSGDLALFEEFSKHVENRKRKVAHHELFREYQCCGDCHEKDRFYWQSQPDSDGKFSGGNQP